MTHSAEATLRFDASVLSQPTFTNGTQGLELTWLATSTPYLGANAQSRSSEVHVGRWEITGIPRNGPIDIFRRSLASPGERLTIQHYRTVVHRDANVDPMGDAQFWSLIDILGGSAKAKPVAKLVTTLRALGVEATSRFAVALHSRLFDLDHPAHAVVKRGRGLEYMSDDASQDRRAAIVARGRAAFERAIAEPGSIAGEKGGAEPLIYIANRVLSSDAEYVVLHTGIPITTGSNLKHWPEVTPAAPDPPMTKEERTLEWQREILSRASVVGEHPTPGDPWYDVALQSNWYAALWLSSTPLGLRESLSVFALPKLDRVLSREDEALDVQRVRGLVSDGTLQAGESLMGPVDVEGCARPTRLHTIASLVPSD